MDALTYFEDARRRYLDLYREAIRERRGGDPTCVPEVWMRPRRPPGDDGDAEPLCVDILCGGSDAPQMVMVATEAAPDGPAVASPLRIGDVEVAVHPITWEVCLVWLRHPEPDWSALDPWRRKWMNPDREADPDDPDGLSSAVHYLACPVAEGGGYQCEADLGSAPVAAHGTARGAGGHGRDRNSGRLLRWGGGPGGTSGNQRHHRGVTISPVRRLSIHLLTLGLALSLLLCVAVCVLWVRSYRHADAVVSWAPFGERITLRSQPGRSQLSQPPPRPLCRRTSRWPCGMEQNGPSRSRTVLTAAV